MAFEATEIVCPSCGQKNRAGSPRCATCAFIFPNPGQSPYAATSDATLGGLIPFKNTQALLAYYLGLFSLFPLLGFPMGITALVLGIRGLKFANLHPEAKGKIHAWIGIITGTLFGLFNGLLVALVVIGIIGMMMGK